ncbi:MAG: thioredoxin family protein [Candidatus Cloacimonetes bacterium]|nr:thioredoxin family protein [Candidatus Cloacimonadota bacterium]
MKYFLILMLIPLLFCGCNKAKPEAEPTEEATEEISVDIDQALSDYEKGSWIEDYDKALQYAKELSRPILANFTGSDWCGWCIKLKGEVFDKPAFQDYAKSKLVLLKLDFPKDIVQTDALKDQNRKLQSKFGIEGYPTIILIDAEGKEIARTGYQPGGDTAYVEHLKQLLN